MDLTFIIFFFAVVMLGKMWGSRSGASPSDTQATFSHPSDWDIQDAPRYRHRKMPQATMTIPSGPTQAAQAAAILAFSPVSWDEHDTPTFLRRDKPIPGVAVGQEEREEAFEVIA
jgi:hypothetical protein